MRHVRLGSKAMEPHCHPLTHDMITALNLLETKHDNTGGPVSSGLDVERSLQHESGGSSPASSTMSESSLSNCDSGPAHNPLSRLSLRPLSPQLYFGWQAYLSTSSQVPLLDRSHFYQAEWAQATAHIRDSNHTIGSGFVM